MSKRIENDIQETTNQEKAGVAILLLDKVDFIRTNVIKNKEGHFIMLEESIEQEGKNLKCVCTK